MRTRVKETGEIIEVQDCSADMYVEKFGELTGRLFHITELDFDNLESPDYWTRLEHQYAGMAMQGILNNSLLINGLLKVNKSHEDIVAEVTGTAIRYAHALVEKMKNQSV